MSEFNKNLAEELAKQVPIKQIYEDGIKTTIKETGETLGLVPRTIKAALAPLEKWILYKEYSIKETQKLLESKLENLQPEKIVTPEPYVAIPAFQAISYSMDNEELRNLYANLLANSMNIDTKDSVHPSYVEIIKQLSPDEVKILNSIYNSNRHLFPLMELRMVVNKNARKYDIIQSHVSVFDFDSTFNVNENSELYFDNLVRLGLVIISYKESLSNKELYKSIENSEKISRFFVSNLDGAEMIYQKGIGKITALGINFLSVCCGTIIK